MKRSVFWRIAWHLALVIVLSVGSALCWVSGQWFLCSLAGLGAVALAVGVGFLFASQLRKGTFLFEALENEDYSFRFDELRGSNLERRYHRSINQMRLLMERLREKSRQREAYYEKILNHSSSGILVIDPTTGIVFQNNRAARELLGVEPLTHVDQLAVVAAELPSALRTVETGRVQSVSYYTERERVELTLSASWIELYDRQLKIVALSNIGTSIDQAQIESWAQLSRVLAHEIMNSLSPITSLSEGLLGTDDPVSLRRGLEVIHTTSRGLIDFVENYRRLTRIPTPVVRRIEILGWLEQTVSLFDRSIEIVGVDRQATLYADVDLLTQVVNNLVKNAVEAAPDEAVWLEVRTEGTRTIIEVCNRGPEIEPAVREQIFVPFFTTKSGGSGIGLSLSRQIMRLHGGTLGHTTRKLSDGTQATVFTLLF